ncbi:hypothetical protein [Campylobacter sp. 19-13652]|uniref:hypothetical protein n=1 Tax=Campylobacter sp. 19-13652 TaxID=2840180 RepID=UPI001C77B087|nr:hypothetical protein [Campylobacter sp. 19-13652]BCX79832.1 hypothetical protein LBC_12940 [Campylobacter sp. 19-13652]
MSGDWLSRFKLAIVNDNAEAIEALADEFNENSVDGVDDLREAQALLSEAVIVLENKKSKIEIELKKANKVRNYMF